MEQKECIKDGLEKNDIAHSSLKSFIEKKITIIFGKHLLTI